MHCQEVFLINIKISESNTGILLTTNPLLCEQWFSAGPTDFLFLSVCVEVLRPSQQLWSCRASQLPINTVPG